MKLTCTLLLITSFTFVFGQELVDSREREIVFRNVNIIPMDSERILQNQTVIVKDRKVTAIGPKLKYSKSALVVDGKGKYLIPGLAEMHAHVPPVDDLEPMKDVLFLFAANGITTIRGMLGHPLHLGLRTMIRNDEIIGPRFYTTGPSFSGFSVKTPEDGERMVRQQKAAGYDFLKLHPGLNKETFPAIANTAKEVGIPFVGHVSFGVGIWRAIDAEYSSIDHLDGFVEGLVPGIETMVDQQAGLFGMFIADKADESQIPKLMKGLKEHNIWVVPTQALAERWFSPSYTPEDFLNEPEVKYMDKEIVKQWLDSKKNLMANPNYHASKINTLITLRRKLIKECQQNGVGLLLGCDAPQIFNVPGFSTHYELEYMVTSGLTAFEALQSGTVNVADYLNLPDAGMIKPGAVADLVLISGNPLVNISQTRNVEGVMLNGRWMSKTVIDAGLKKLEK